MFLNETPLFGFSVIFGSLLVFIAFTVWRMGRLISVIHLLVEDLWMKKATLEEQEMIVERIKARHNYPVA